MPKKTSTLNSKQIIFNIVKIFYTLANMVEMIYFGLKEYVGLTMIVQVASWGAYLLSRNILTVSFAPRDTHIAQVQFALERGVPALIGVLASIRLPYPSRAFDMAHCSRCLIPWGKNGNPFLIQCADTFYCTSLSVKIELASNF